MSEGLRKEVLEYLISYTAVVMATSKQDNPRDASILYTHDSFNIIVHTIADTTKVRSVEVNPNVALVIDDQAQEGWGQMKTFQYLGKAEILKNSEEQQKVTCPHK